MRRSLSGFIAYAMAMVGVVCVRAFTGVCWTVYVYWVDAGKAMCVCLLGVCWLVLSVYVRVIASMRERAIQRSRQTDRQTDRHTHTHTQAITTMTTIGYGDIRFFFLLSGHTKSQQRGVGIGVGRWVEGGWVGVRYGWVGVRYGCMSIWGASHKESIMSI